MHIALDLKHHCVETEIRRCYHRSISRYFKEKTGRQRLEEEIELLRTALERLDFPALRKQFSQLAGNTPATVSLLPGSQAGVQIVIDGKPVF